MLHIGWQVQVLNLRKPFSWKIEKITEIQIGSIILHLTAGFIYIVLNQSPFTNVWNVFLKAVPLIIPTCSIFFWIFLDFLQYFLAALFIILIVKTILIDNFFKLVYLPAGAPVKKAQINVTPLMCDL